MTFERGAEVGEFSAIGAAGFDKLYAVSLDYANLADGFIALPHERSDCLCGGRFQPVFHKLMSSRDYTAADRCLSYSLDYDGIGWSVAHQNGNRVDREYALVPSAVVLAGVGRW